MPNGSILIISRNNLPLTKAAVRSAVIQDVPCDVLVIDNASTDGTVNWLKTKDIATVSFGFQKSLSACWNAGLKAFWGTGTKEVLVINNDVQLRWDTYRMLASHGGPFVTCVSVDQADKIGKEGDRDIDTLREGQRPHPDFSCFMIRKGVVDRIGYFDEAYFPAYCEDSDYHIRMHRAGIKAVCIDLPFLHLGAQTVKLADIGERARIMRGADENRQRFRKKYGCLPGTEEYYQLFKV